MEFVKDSVIWNSFSFVEFAAGARDVGFQFDDLTGGMRRGLDGEGDAPFTRNRHHADVQVGRGGEADVIAELREVALDVFVYGACHVRHR